MFAINITSTKEAHQTARLGATKPRCGCCHAKCRSPCRVGVGANTFAERCATELKIKDSTAACARMSECFKQDRTCVRYRTWTAKVATRPRRCNSAKSLRRSRRETDTTTMARVIELLYFGKIVDVFVAHGARRVGGMKKRETPMTRSYKIPEVAQEFGKKLACVLWKGSDCCARVGRGEKGVQRGKLGPPQRKNCALVRSKEQRASCLPAIER